MDYQRIYQQFIAGRKAKEPEFYHGKNYTSRVKIGAMASGEFLAQHHIIPRHIKRSDHHSNIVALTPYEHYFAHLLLAKHYDTPELWFSVLCVLNTYKLKRLSKRVHGAMVNAATKIAMVDNNPSKKEENRQLLSDLKKIHNPMHNSEALEKMRSTRIKQNQENPEMNVVYRVDWLGKKLPLKEACKSAGIVYGNVVARVHQTKCTHAEAFEHFLIPKDERVKLKSQRIKSAHGTCGATAKYIVIVGGKTYSLPKACAMLDVSEDSVRLWVNKGMSANDAFYFVKDTPSEIRNKDLFKATSEAAKVKVKCLCTGIVFDSINSACDFVSISRSHMSKVLRGIKKTAGGYRWAYA